MATRWLLSTCYWLDSAKGIVKEIVIVTPPDVETSTAAGLFSMSAQAIPTQSRARCRRPQSSKALSASKCRVKNKRPNGANHAYAHEQGSANSDNGPCRSQGTSPRTAGNPCTHQSAAPIKNKTAKLIKLLYAAGRNSMLIETLRELLREVVPDGVSDWSR